MSLLVTNNVATPEGKFLLRSSGNIVQMTRVRSDAQTGYTSQPTGDGTTITDLNISITPTSATNRLIIVWHIFHEVDHRNNFLVHRGGALITDAGEQGYNNVVGNVRYSGYVGATYDNATNNASTPHVIKLTYSEIAGSTTARTYAPAIRGSTATAYSFQLNRCITAPADVNEVGVSFGRIYEVTV